MVKDILPKRGQKESFKMKKINSKAKENFLHTSVSWTFQRKSILLGKSVRPKVIDSTRNRNGFTLIELLIVLVLLGILTGIALPNYFNASDRARENAAELAVILAAKACAASLVTNKTFTPVDNVTGSCSNSATFTSVNSAFGISTQSAVATVDQNKVALTQKAIK